MGSGIDALFDSRFSKPSRKERFALALVGVGDGEFLLVKVRDGSKPKVMGSIWGEDNAQELAEIINMLGNGLCDASFEGDLEGVADELGRAFGEGDIDWGGILDD